MDSSYIKSAQLAEQLPPFEEPEIGVIGRSNCGKSSLLNALFGTRKLVKTGSTPGHTKMVNFFHLKTGDGERIFADLPGYGFAAAGKASRKNWKSLMDAYILRPNIQEFMFLIDCRRTLNEEDLALYEYIASKRPVRLVLTKSDKVNQSDAQKAKAAAPKRCKTPPLGTHIVSASKLKGIDALRTELFKTDETLPSEIDGEARP